MGGINKMFGQENNTMSNSSITVYWSTPQLFTGNNPHNVSTFFYREPTSVVAPLRKIQKERGSNFLACPAFSDMFANIYQLECPIDLDLNIKEEDAIEEFSGRAFHKITNDRINLLKGRPSNLSGYFSCMLNLRWTFFADEPLTMRFTPPYFPLIVPAEGAIPVAGQFDIGSWFRPLQMEYHLPVGTTKFSYKEGDPLAFIEFMTEKEIVLKRFNYSDKLSIYQEECVNSPVKYGRFIPLKRRYEMAKKSKLREMVLAEIKNNLVE
jgi:hypothetical protein